MFVLALLTCSTVLTIACGVPGHLTRDVPKTAITNVHVFDSGSFGQPTTVVLSGGIISNANPAGATIVDGKGGYLIPGLIDAHCHMAACADLTPMRQYGITTALDMGTYPYSSIKACRAAGVTDVKGPGPAATVNGSAISGLPGYPTSEFISTPAAGVAFVKKRISEEVDYIKVFLDPKGPDEATLAAVVATAHAAGLRVISHAPSYADYTLAEQAGVDIPTHAPLDKPLDSTLVSNLVASHHHVVPTLIMMQSIVNNTGAPYFLYTTAAEGSVTAMHKAGVPIAAGSDANNSPYVPANPPFGDSLHSELELLVAAGLSNVEALQAATSVAAATFGLYDRGSTRPGLRADLVLLGADPTVDIKNTRTIQKVWLAGIEAPGL